MKKTLVVSLKLDEKIWVGDAEVVIKSIRTNRVELLFFADSSIKITRDKLLKQKQGESHDANGNN